MNGAQHKTESLLTVKQGLSQVSTIERRSQSLWITPALSELDPGIEPTEFNVLLAMAVKPEKTAGGIILADETKEREQFGSSHARLVAVSPLAFSYEKTWPADARKPQVGDIVFSGKFPGEEIIGRDGLTYRICSDREIAAVIERAEDGTRILSELGSLDDFLREEGLEEEVTARAVKRVAEAQEQNHG